MAPTAIDDISNAPHNDAIVVDEQIAIPDGCFESKKLETWQPLLVNGVEPASPLDSELPSPPNGGHTTPILESSTIEASDIPEATETSATTGNGMPVVGDGAVQVPEETVIPTIVDLEAPTVIEAAAAPVVAPAVRAPCLSAHIVPGTKLPASTRLQKMIKETNELIVCPGVYDGLSARTAIEVGFDSLYMV